MKRFVLTVCVLLAVVSFASAQKYDFIGEHNKKSPIYKPGEEMIFSVKFLKDGNAVDGVPLKWKRTGDDGLVQTGEGVSSKEGLKIKTATNKPGFVRIVVTPYDKNGKPMRMTRNGRPWRLNLEIGACVAPETLQGLPEPKDFDAFWAAQKKKLAATPMKVLEMKEVEGNDKVKAYDVKIACAGGMPVSGYLTMPRNAKPKSLPAEVSYQGYGVRGSGKNLWAGRKGIHLNINAHGLPNGKPGAFYQNLAKTSLKNYGFDEKENSDREKTYFNGMMLRALRALEFVKTLPEWDGKNLKASGGSQGGMQSLVVTGLDPDITECYAWSPWNCDIGRTKLGREMGSWGLKYTPALEYYDPINHVKRANPKCKLEIVANLGDYVCPASGVWIAFNNFPGPKKMEVRQACQHLVHPKTFSKFKIEKPAKK